MTRAIRFRTTIWSDVVRAQRGSTASLERVCDRYREPVRRYIRSMDVSAADAEDLTQEVFQRILERNLLQKADRERWPFRGLLLGITRNIVRENRRRVAARRREADAALASLPPEQDGFVSLEPGDAGQQDELFDRLWVRNLLELAIERMSRADSKRGDQYATLLKARALEELTYEELAERFGLQMHDIKNSLHRARKRVREQIRKLVQDYSSSRPEYEAELRSVAQYLTGTSG